MSTTEVKGIQRDDTVHDETYFTAADMATAAAQGFRDGQAAGDAGTVASCDYKSMFGAAVSTIAAISEALGIDEEEAACANGAELILEAIQRKNDAILAAMQKRPPVPPEGMVMVPKEPTLDMGWAYLDAATASDPLRTHSFNHAGYRAMIAAAPAQPVAKPLKVFSKGPWTFRETGQDFSGADLDEAAFVAYRERASRGQAPAQAAPAYKDSTPELHIGDSVFESWYSTYSPAHKSDKQRARDAYAAGMGDPLVVAAHTPQADSVQEDADPLQGAANWLAQAHGQFCVAVLQGCLMIGYNRAKRLHDASIAARKQGANHD